MRPFINTTLFFALLLSIFATPLIVKAVKADQTHFEQEYQQKSWEQIVAEARGEVVYFYMWGGSKNINQFVDNYLKRRLLDEHSILLERRSVSDPPDFIAKVRQEKQQGIKRRGTVDLMWVNGENFNVLKEEGLLFGPFAEALPNSSLVNWNRQNIAYDFGIAVENHEVPFGSSQFVMIYNRAHLALPPTKLEDLISWIRSNPGRFTYPAPPDFTGSAFIRHLFYHEAGGTHELMGTFNQVKFDEVAPKLWKRLNELEPYLWEKGNTYPETQGHLEELYGQGKVWFSMSYNPARASHLVQRGDFPPSTRTFVFDSGTLSNTHYVTISFNANAPAASMVVANLLMDVKTQFHKAQPYVWGDGTVIDLGRLSPQWVNRFKQIAHHESILPPLELAAKQLPELHPEWVAALEKGWRKEVYLK